MKVRNQNGLGHNLTIVIAAVVVMIGAAGYFVWQRQKDSGIDAKAASTTLYSQVIDGQNVSIKACRIKGKLSVNVTYSKGTASSLSGAKALLAGLATDSDKDVESTNWDKAGNLTIRNYYVGQAGANGSSFDAFIIPVSTTLPNNGGVMQVNITSLPTC